MFNKPSLYLTDEEKYSRKNNLEEMVPKYFRDCQSYYSSTGSMTNTTFSIMAELYVAYNNHTNSLDYDAVVNPHNQSSEYLTRMKSLLRNYDIITPVILRKIGDFLRRGDFLRVVTTSPDDDNILAEKVNTFLKKKLEEEFVKRSSVVNPTDAEANQRITIDFEKLARDFKDKTYSSTIVKRNAAILKDLKKILMLTFKWALMLEDYLITGRCYSYKNIHNEQLVYLQIHPLDVKPIEPSNLSFFIEDCGAVEAYYYLGLGELEDLFGDKELFQKNRRYIESLYTESAMTMGGTDYKVFQNERQYTNSIDSNLLRTNTINKKLIVHQEWKTKRLVKRLRFYDEAGEIQTLDVTTDYELDIDNGDIDFTEVWIDSKCHNWFIRMSLTGQTDTIDHNCFLDYGCSDISRNDKGSISGEPLSYNGIIRGFNPDNVISDVRAGIPYAQLYNSIMYRTDLLINRMISNLTLIPYSLIPKDKGWDTEKFISYIRTFEIVFADDATPEARQSLQHVKSLSVSSYDHVLRLYEIAESVKSNYWERVGTNRQSMGQTMASDLNGVNQMAVNQASAADTWQLFMIDQYFEREVSGLLDYMKFLKSDGWQANVLMGKKEVFALDIPGEQLLNTDMNTYISASPEEAQKVETMRSNALGFIQNNNGNYRDVAEVVDADNMEDIKQYLEEADEEMKQLQANIREQEQAVQKYVADKAVEAEEIKSARQKYTDDKRAETALEVAMLTADSFNAGTDKDTDGIDDSIEIEMRAAERQLKLRQQNELERKNRVSEVQKAQALKLQAEKNKQSKSSSN